MLYYSHGLGEAFCNYGDYFNGHQDDNAICYLTLANRLIHQVNAKAITIPDTSSDWRQNMKMAATDLITVWP